MTNVFAEKKEKKKINIFGLKIKDILYSYDTDASTGLGFYVSSKAF